MTVVRDLVARLGFQVDKSGFKEAEKALDNVRKAVGRTKSEVASAQTRDAHGRFIGKGRGGAAAATGAAAAAGAGGGELMKTLGKVAATAGLTHVIESMVEMASTAEETRNVLSSVFGAEGQKDVSDWAQRTATEVGRSKYELEKFVGQLGAVATPMLGNADRAREMSESYAKLAVDMASFYNTNDEDALLALRSAMTGEVESIKRYGVVMNEATMAEYAHSQGIKKKISQMTNAEKTELRYGYIMKVTAAAQGDAARTGNGYANSIKRVKSLMTDFGTDMGRAVLPKIEKFLVVAADAINTFKEWTDGTHALEAAMYTLSAIAGVLAIDLLAPFILPALAIGGLILLVDDLWNLFTEGESVIGDLLDEMFGMGTAEAVVNGLADAWQWLSDTFTELQQTMPDLVGIWDTLMGVGEEFGLMLSRWQEQLLHFVKTVHDLPKMLGNKVAGLLGLDVEQEDAYGRAAGRGINADVLDGGVLGFGNKATQVSEREREDRIRGEVAKRDEVRAQRRDERDKRLKIRELQKDMRKDADALAAPNLSAEDRAKLEQTQAGRQKELASLTGADSEAVLMAGERADTGPRFGVARHLRAVEPSVSAPLDAAAAAAPSNVNVQQSNVFNINGGNPNEVRRVVKEELDSQRRRTAAALPRPAGA